MAWVELDTLVVGDGVRIRHQNMVVKIVRRVRGGVELTGQTEDGRQVVYVGLSDELVQQQRVWVYHE